MSEHVEYCAAQRLGPIVAATNRRDTADFDVAVAACSVRPDRFEPHQVAPGRQPGQHPLHGHPPEDLGAREQLIGRYRQLTRTIQGAHPWPAHR